MNKQIKELAHEAGIVKILEEHASEYGAGTFENTPYPELEKFALLIVEECIDQIKISSPDRPYLENQIKKRLGIAE